MAAEATLEEPRTPARDQSHTDQVASKAHDVTEQDSDDDGADEEPKLKYTRLTSNLLSLYRNGDATSTFIVAGDKMIIGTHNGNIHTINVPSFQILRTYNAHASASVTALSVSPLLPSQPFTPSTSVESSEISSRHAATTASHSSSPRTPRQPQVPAIPSNQIYIASASIDGHVCVSSLVDPKDVTLRNFGRPVQAVALSPDYKSDRTYLSGGLAGELILTSDVPIGTKSTANTSSASQSAQGWLGAIGLGGHGGGKDTILHSGEGTIGSIKWSLSGKFVAWSNEHGIWIMRTNLHLDSADTETAWKRINFIDKPNRRIWQDMASVWKARMDWADDRSLETDDDATSSMNGNQSNDKAESTLPHQRMHPHKQSPKKKAAEKLVIGWGDAAWIIRVYPGGPGTGKHVGQRSAGSAESVHSLHFDDCVIAGISLYTPSVLLLLAYRTRDDDDKPIAYEDTTPRRGMHRRVNGLSPELRLIDAATSDEIEVDSLTMSRYESLSAADYHLGTLYVPHPQTMTPAQRSALEAIGGGIWDVTAGAARIFSTGATSVMTMPFGSDTKTPPKALSMSSASAGNVSSTTPSRRPTQVVPNAATAGLKVFIHSPYDCVLAIKRDLADHFQWELEHENYKDAWELLEDHPEIVAPIAQQPESSPVTSPVKQQGSLHEFFADGSETQSTMSVTRTNQNSQIEKEKRRIGDLWVQQLVSAGNWREAGKTTGRVLGNSSRWEHWVWKFAQSNHFNEISPYIPKKQMQPPLPSMVYEVVLGHYIIHDRTRFKHLLEAWDPELYDINSVIEAIKSKLTAGDVTEESVEGDEQGRDWRILQDGLAKLYLASGRQREALRCFIVLQNADSAMSLIREFHLVEAVRDDIPGFILMRITKEQVDSAPLPELEESSEEAINVLVEEGCRGTIPANDVVDQLQSKEEAFKPFLFFYLRRLWKPELHERTAKTAKERVAEDRLAADGKIVAEEFADLMVELFAEYDRPLLMEYLRRSQSYDLSKATADCERREYIPELVHILSKTGQTKRALYLIIEKLSDVSFAISFAKEQDDPDLWNDLLEYSMDKPHFIRGLLEEVGTAIDPIKLVRRIPEGLEIEGLRDGIGRMVREYEIQHSISEGVARVLRGEVAAGMDTLRAGQKRGVKFELTLCDDTPAHAQHKHTDDRKVDVEPKAINPVRAAKVTAQADNVTTAVTSTTNAPNIDPPPVPVPEGEAPSGHCTGCHRPFTLPTPEEETMIVGPLPLSRDTLVGFACGHVFHLSCLLPKTSASASVAATLQRQLTEDAIENEDRWIRSTTAKVAHARVIKHAVGRGCVVCREREGIVGGE